MKRTRLSVWPPLPPTIHLRRPRTLPFPFDRDYRFYARARAGLWQALRRVGLEAGSVVLAPAFHHGSEIESLIRAGLHVRFYEIDDRVAPDPTIDDLVDERTKALHLTHVLGIPQDAPKWRRWADERGLLLIEDVAQGWPGAAWGAPLGSWGDIAIFCAYKTFAVPDGGVVTGPSLPDPPRLGGAGVRSLARRHGAWAIARSSALADVRVRFQRHHEFSHEEDIALGDPSRGPLRSSRYALSRVFDPLATQRRRDNFEYLRAGVPGCFSPSFDVDLQESSPFAFPIEVDGKADIDHELMREGIGPERFWAFPHPALDVERFPRSARLRERLLALPVHQELKPVDLERIATVTQRVVKRLGGAQ